MASQQQTACEAIASLQYSGPHPLSQRFTPLHITQKVTSYSRLLQPRIQGVSGGHPPTPVPHKQHLSQLHISSQYQNAASVTSRGSMKPISPDQSRSYLSNRSSSLPTSLGDSFLPLMPSPGGQGRTNASPYKASSRTPMGHPKSLATVRLLPIRSKAPPPDHENPLDRHRRTDVLLTATQPALANTLVSRRVQQVASQNTSTQLEGITKVLQDLEGDPSYSRAREYVEAGLLTHLRNCLRIHDSSEVRLPTLQIISNLVSGPPELTDSVVGSGCAPYLLPLVSSSDAALAEEAVWALVNMAGDSAEVRELVLRAGIMPTMIRIITSESWAQTREDVTSAFAQKLGSGPEDSNIERSPASSSSSARRASEPRVLGRRSSSNPSMSTPVLPRDVEVRQSARGGSVTNLLVPSVQIPRTAGTKSRKKEENC